MIRKLVPMLLWAAWLMSGGAFAADEKLTILSYHEIADPADALNKDYAVRPTMFVRQMDWLRNNGYHFVTIDDLLADEAGRRPLPDKAVLITFDDGYRSMFDHAWPILKAWRIPAVVAVVGIWEDDRTTVNFDGKIIPREKLMSWKELRELSDSGLVEIGSHSFDLHRGIQGNPQGSEQPAATTRLWLGTGKGYESEVAYRQRVESDMAKSSSDIKAHIGRAPRIIAWPYGRYNDIAREAATRRGMTIGLTLDDGANMADTPLWGLRRILVDSSMGLWELNREITIRNQNLNDNDRPMKAMHIDLDYIFDPDPAQVERNLSHLLDRITFLGVNTVFLQAFADPDGDGSADAVYFPNRHLPVRSDLFNRVAWQIRTRTPVRRLYAWMPLAAWSLPAGTPAANDRVVTLPGDTSGHVTMGYRRLSLFSPRARQVIGEIYEDLGQYATFDGILFHDDSTLSDYEDASEFAQAAYRSWGLPATVPEIRKSDDLLGRWTILKINAIDDFAGELAAKVRQNRPGVPIARNLFARVVLSPKAEVWYSQALENSLRHYDFTAIMAMPYMEQAPDHAAFYSDLVKKVLDRPGAIDRVVFELQTVDWRKDNTLLSTDEIVATIRRLYDLGAVHVAYYPDMLFQNHPAPAAIRAVLATKPNDAKLH
jgi:poly-beta-1,6-N-acetyl-D-glucosamine N-deacetylase